MKDWLIKKLGGYTKEEHQNVIKRLQNVSFVEELEYRVRGGNEVFIGVRNISYFNHIVQMFNKDTVKINKKDLTIKYNDIRFKVLNVTNYNEIKKIKGIKLNGFFFID